MRTWIYFGASLACYAIIEYLTRTNPLDRFYSSANPPLLQTWATYRVMTTIGHPLVNAVFFGVAAIFAFAEFLQTRRRVVLLCMVLSLLAVAATASRGAVVALAVGMPCVVAVSLADSATDRRSLNRIVGALALVGLVMVVSAGPVMQRNASAEGSTSKQSRSLTVREGLKIVQKEPWLGVGPGVVDDYKRAAAIGHGRDIGLENSWLALLAAIGVPGALVAAHLLWSSLATAVRGRRAHQLGALIAYSIMAGSFKLLEGDRPALIMFGIVVGVCFVRSDHSMEEARVYPTRERL